VVTGAHLWPASRIVCTFRGDARGPRPASDRGLRAEPRRDCTAEGPRDRFGDVWRALVSTRQRTSVRFGDGGYGCHERSHPRRSGLREIREYGWRERYVSARIGNQFAHRCDPGRQSSEVKLGSLAADNARRQAIADRYDAGLAGSAVGASGHDAPSRPHVFHQYVIRLAERDGLRDRLRAAGIGNRDSLSGSGPPTAGFIAADLAAGPSGLGRDRARRRSLSLPIYPQLSGEANRPCYRRDPRLCQVVRPVTLVSSMLANQQNAARPIITMASHSAASRGARSKGYARGTADDLRSSQLLPRGKTRPRLEAAKII